MRAARGLTFLIVDDDPADVLLIRETLEASGYAQAVHAVADGHAALAFLTRTGEHTAAPRPDVVLLDLNMPGKDGRQVLAETKTDPRLASIPILVFTTSQNQDDVLASYSLYANAYVNKPVNLDEFAVVVDQIGEFFTRVVALPAAS